MRNPARIFILLGALTCILQSGLALTCYRCSITPAQYVGEVDLPCSKFDESSKFVIECPSSTFCMKRIIPYRLANGSMAYTTAERNCASQKHEYHDYNYDDKKWHKKESVVKDAYAEGCFKDGNVLSPNGPSEHCYCTGDYCNESSPMTKPLQICSLLVVSMVLVLSFTL